MRKTEELPLRLPKGMDEVGIDVVVTGLAAALISEETVEAAGELLLEPPAGIDDVGVGAEKPPVEAVLNAPEGLFSVVTGDPDGTSVKEELGELVKDVPGRDAEASVQGK